MSDYSSVNQKTSSNKESTVNKSDKFVFKGLGSDWSGLNRYLIAQIYPVVSNIDDNGNRYYTKDAKEKTVFAPLVEGAELEMTFNWQSPFEQTGPESKAPAITAMLQSGKLRGLLSSFIGQPQQGEDEQSSGIGELLKQAEGRAGITKLNSTQTFNGMQPVKLNLKLIFRAKKDAYTEVEKPIQKLIEWATPQKLSQDGAIVNLLKGVKEKNNLIDTLLPSVAPRLVALNYKGKLYTPLVIESISVPITAPTTSGGYLASAEATLSLSSLTALDRDDIKQIYSRSR